MKTDEPRQNRIPFMMSDAELAAVDEWRFANKIATRAEAIRRLVQIGIYADRVAPELWELVKSVSHHDGILSAIRADADALERELVSMSDEFPERVHMLMSALKLKQTIDAFREGLTVDESMEASNSVEAAIAQKLSALLPGRKDEQ